MKKRDPKWYDRITQPNMSLEGGQDFKIHLHEISIDYNRDAYGLITIKQKKEKKNQPR
jgi:hypothetical protein